MANLYEALKGDDAHIVALRVAKEHKVPLPSAADSVPEIGTKFVIKGVGGAEVTGLTVRGDGIHPILAIDRPDAGRDGKMPESLNGMTVTYDSKGNANIQPTLDELAEKGAKLPKLASVSQAQIGTASAALPAKAQGSQRGI